MKTATAVQALCEAIRRTKGIQQVRCEHSAGLVPSKLADREEEYSVTIGPEARELFAGLGGLRLEWRYETEELAADNYYIEGQAKLLDFHHMMMGFDGRFWRNELWFDDMPAEQLAFAKRLRVVDDFGAGASVPAWVCLEVVDDVVTSRLWLYHRGSQPVRLELDLGGYIDALRETKGIWGWQYFYADINLSRHDREQTRAECNEVVTWYPRIFDDGFEAQLRERLQRRLR